MWDVGDGIRHSRRTAPVEYASFGKIATADVLGDEGAMERVRRAGQEAIETIQLPTSLRTIFEVSWGFAGSTELATDRIAEVVARIRNEGGAATMAMIGKTVVATGETGILDDTTRIADAGAQLR